MKKLTLMFSLFVFVVIGATEANALGLQNRIQQRISDDVQPICTQEYAPVCAEKTVKNAVKRVTFPNACLAKAAGGKIIHDGKCETTNGVNPTKGVLELQAKKIKKLPKKMPVDIQALRGNRNINPQQVKQAKQARQAAGAIKNNGNRRAVVAGQLEGNHRFVGDREEIKKRIEDARKEVRQFREKSSDQIKKYREGIKIEVSEARAKVEAKRKEYEEKLKNASSKIEKTAIWDKINIERKRLTEKIEERRKEIFDRTKEFVKSRLEKTDRRLSAYLRRGESVYSRTDTRLKSLEDKGYDTSKLREKMSQAKKYLESVKSDYLKFKEAIKKIADSGSKEELKEVLKSAKEAISVFKSDIKSFFKEVREIIRDMMILPEDIMPKKTLTLPEGALNQTF